MQGKSKTGLRRSLFEPEGSARHQNEPQKNRFEVASIGVPLPRSQAIGLFSTLVYGGTWPAEVFQRERQSSCTANAPRTLGAHA